VPDSRKRPQWLPQWLNEPLLHFLLLGAALFAVDHVLFTRTDDPNVITVGPEVDKEARELFKNSRGQDPTPEQLAALRQVWLDNEVLYREGLALRVDQGDTAIRERVIFKALSIVETGVSLPPVDAKTLRAWFDANRAKYDEPARYDFQEAVLSGDSSEAAAQAFAADLNRGAGGDVKAGLRVFKGRPHANLVLSYGEDFAKTLERLPPNEWRALQTRDGWRVMRLDTVVPGKAADFEAVVNVVTQDWTDATMAAQRTAAVRALAKKYTVRMAGKAP
jgi:hypothetical protein